MLGSKRTLSGSASFCCPPSRCSRAAAFAQGASPSLTARVAGIDSEAAARKLRIDTLDVRVRIRGTIAETTITARFANPGSEHWRATSRWRCRRARW